MEVLKKKEIAQVENRGRENLIRTIKEFIETFRGEENPPLYDSDIRRQTSDFRPKWRQWPRDDRRRFTKNFGYLNISEI